MKLSNTKLYACCAVFAMYWLCTFVVSFSATNAASADARKTNFLSSLFYQNWSFFTPPFKNNFRLYLISKDTLSNLTDTVETLKSAAGQRNDRAPFNQSEDLLLQMLYGNIHSIHYDVQQRILQLQQKNLNSSEEQYMKAASAEMLKENACKENINFLRRYAKFFYESGGRKIKNKQLKIVIAAREINPYSKRWEETNKQKEKLFFTTGFMPIP